MKRSKQGLFVFPPNMNMIWRRHCPIGQSCYSMTSKQCIGGFLKSSRAWSFLTRAFAKPIKIHARLYLFNKPIKWLYFRSFVVSVLFARFHFKVTRKSLKQNEPDSRVTAPSILQPNDLKQNNRTVTPWKELNISVKVSALSVSNIWREFTSISSLNSWSPQMCWSK